MGTLAIPGNPREIVTIAERRFPVRIRIGVPTGAFGQRHTDITTWLDQNCGATVSRQISTAAETRSIRLSITKGESVTERAATPAPIATGASITIQAAVRVFRARLLFRRAREGGDRIVGGPR